MKRRRVPRPQFSRTHAVNIALIIAYVGGRWGLHIDADAMAETMLIAWPVAMSVMREVHTRLPRKGKAR